MNSYEALLAEVERVFAAGLTTQTMMQLMEKIGAPVYPASYYEDFRLWNDYQPLAKQRPFTQKQRYLHLLWETVDKTPLGLSAAFGIPFRRLVAKQLFKHCGKNLVCSDSVRINFGQFLEVGDDVMLTLGCFLDTKGGLSIGSHAVLAENVTVFTHAHDEANHTQRHYAPVEIGAFARIGAGSMLMPGVKVGRQALVGAGAIVTKDVPENAVVMGAPAKVVRQRRNAGHENAALNHFYFADEAFQKE